MFLFDPLFYFPTTSVTLLYLASHKEFHEFLELKFHNNFWGNYNPSQNIWHKLKKYSKIG